MQICRQLYAHKSRFSDDNSMREVNQGVILELSEVFLSKIKEF